MYRYSKLFIAKAHNKDTTESDRAEAWTVFVEKFSYSSIVCFGDSSILNKAHRITVH
jgi:hypothetical protein